MTDSEYPGNGRLLSTANGGTALSTTRAFIPIPPGIGSVTIIPRNFATAVVVKLALNPFLSVMKSSDSMSTAPVDYSEAAQDGDAATLVTLSSLPTLANGGAVYVGAGDRFSGLMATLATTNSNGGTMAVTYWNGTAWTDITPTDGTSNMNATGLITWTVPTAWVPESLSSILSRSFAGLGRTQFWVRIATSAAYDASVTLSSLYAYNRYADAGIELIANEALKVGVDRAQNGGVIQALTNAGTANLIVNGFY